MITQLGVIRRSIASTKLLSSRLLWRFVLDIMTAWITGHRPYDSGGSVIKPTLGAPPACNSTIASTTRP